MAFGFLVILSAVQTSQSEAAGEAGRTDLIAQVRSGRADLEKKQARAASLRAEVAEVRAKVLSSTALSQQTRAKLAQLGMGDVDADAVLRACLPEALGGVEGSHARLRALVVAFGMPESLVSAGLDETGGGRRFFPQGWPRTVLPPIFEPLA